MVQERKHEGNVLVWKTKDGEKLITSLQELLETLILIQQENIDEEISMNIEEEKLVVWLEENFSRQLNLIETVKNIQKEFTPQQIREKLIRELRTLT